MKKSLLALALAGLYTSSASAATPTVEEMWEIIQQQQSEISRLKGAQQQTDNKVNATAETVENSSIASVAEWVNKTSIGGYGEMHINQLDNQKTGGTDKEEIDLHRFVLFFGHQFTDTVRLFSELEVEHSVAGDGKNGEVELEQAYVEWDFAENHSAKAGVFLVPVGIINETHEPNTFYGTERNPVENNIIPATWWEGGAAVKGEVAEGLNYDFAIHSGLSIDTGAGKFKVRDGRKKVSEAPAENAAFTGRVKYTGIQGLELAATVQHQTDITQGAGISASTNIAANLFETHASYQTGPFGIKALYAMWDIDNAIVTDSGVAGADKQEGFYIEPSYKLTEKLGIFARYNQWDNQAGDNSVDSEYQQVDVGMNYWLTSNVVLKADYQDQDAPAGKDEFDGVNLGVGWSF